MTDQGTATGRRRTVAVGLLVDPGLSAALADRLHDVVPDRLRARVTDTVSWTVDTVQDPFEAMYPHQSRLMEKAREHVRGTVWDLVICITDQPMQDESGVVVARVDIDDRVAVVSLPALGGWRLRHRLSTVVVAIIACLTARIDPDADPDADPAGTAGIAELRRRLSARVTRVVAPRSATQLDVVAPGWRARPRLLAGMVRVNRPWRLFLGLSTAMAGALTGIAFGVLYSSIWTLGDSLGPLRLVGMTVAAIATMAVWIIGGHQLWERQRRTGDGRDRQVRLRNASTVITVMAGTVALFLAMLTIALAAVALVIPPSYLAATLGHPVGVSDYLVVALMASVLGTIAGAVGSGLEDDTTVREVTYAYREQERRRRVDQDGDTPTHRYRRS